MQRRSFLEALTASAATASAATSPAIKNKFFVLDQFFLKNGTQPARIHDYLQKALPLLTKAHDGPTIVLEALAAPHMPQVAFIHGYKSFEDWRGTLYRVHGTEEDRKLVADWESGDEAPFEHSTTTLLEATNYMPELTIPATAPKSPRVFELRVYHSPTWRQLAALHERFAGPEIRIFHRVGIHPILYTSTIAGANMPNLTYLTPFDDLAAREKAWNAFSADPEWIKVRKESIDKHGQISSVMQISLYKATAYSPIR